MSIKNSKGALEMSVGTIVTIVLLMSVLVLGLFFIQKIFNSGSNAITSIDSQVQNEIAKLFSEGGNVLAIYPNSQDITIKKGDTPRGFAFSIKNRDTSPHSYKYEIFAQEGFDYKAQCGPRMTQPKADKYLILYTGRLTIPGSATLSNPELVRFNVPESAISCTIPYRLNINYDDKDNQGPFEGATLFVTIK